MAQGSRLPTHGRARCAAIDDLEVVLLADTVWTLDKMVTEGWPVADAVDAYRRWWHSLVDFSIDGGLTEWTWRGRS